MADEVKIRITVDGSGESSGETPGVAPSVKGPQARENAKSYFSLRVAEQVVVNAAQQAANIGISHIGFYGGNTVLQEQLQNTMSIASQAVHIGMAFVANPLLGAVSLVGTTVSNVDNYLKYVRSIERSNFQAEQMARRAGYLSNANR